MAPGRAVLTRVLCWQVAPDAALSSRLRAGPGSDPGHPDCGEPPLLSLARAPLWLQRRCRPDPRGSAMSGVLKIPMQKASARCGGSETHIPGACSSSNWRSSICFRRAGDGMQVPNPAWPLLPWHPPAHSVPPAPSRALCAGCWWCSWSPPCRGTLGMSTAAAPGSQWV